MKEKFSIEKFDNWDKDIWVYEAGEKEGDGLRIRIDHDDVNHRVIRQKVKKMVAILNEHWKD